ncbi:MAG: hypothetical protein AB7P97_21445 [Hyphomonadaceae bacterium]
MKNKGFILVADVLVDEELERTDLHIEDTIAGLVAPDDDTTSVVRVWISEIGRTLEFSRNEAKDFMTAMGIIVDRYEITPEEWEARNA